MDKQGARALRDYQKDVEKMLDNMVPWRKRNRRSSGIQNHRGKIKPGEVVVLLEGEEPANYPLFQNAKVIRE